MIFTAAGLFKVGLYFIQQLLVWLFVFAAANGFNWASEIWLDRTISFRMIFLRHIRDRNTIEESLGLWRTLDQRWAPSIFAKTANDAADTSGVPIYFRVPLIPPVSRRPFELNPMSQALSIRSWIWKTDGMSFPKISHPDDLVLIMYDIKHWMFLYPQNPPDRPRDRISFADSWNYSVRCQREQQGLPSWRSLDTCCTQGLQK